MAQNASIRQVLGTDKILKLNNFNLLGLVSGENWSPNFNPTDIFELGRDSKLDTAMELEMQGSFDVAATGHMPGILARMRVTRSASGAFTGYLYNSGTSTNTYTFVQNDLKEMQFDIVIYERPDQTSFSRSVVLPRCFLTNFSGSIDANGMATESYSWAGAEVVGLSSPYHDVLCIPARVVSGTTLQLLKPDGTDDTTTGSATYSLLYAWADERRYGTSALDASNNVALGATGLVTGTFASGYTFPTNAIGRVLVYKTTAPSTTFAQIGAGASERGTSAFYVKAYQAKIYLAPSVVTAPVDSELWLKAQSCSFSVDMRVEALRQILQNAQGTAIYARVPVFPIDISMSVSTLESDWDDWSRIMSNARSGVYASTFEWNPQLLKNTFAVVLQYYTKGGTLLQTLRFTDLRMQDYGERTNIGGRSELSWSLKGSAFTMVGATA